MHGILIQYFQRHTSYTTTLDKQDLYKYSFSYYYVSIIFWTMEPVDSLPKCALLPSSISIPLSY